MIVTWRDKMEKKKVKSIFYRRAAIDVNSSTRGSFTRGGTLRCASEWDGMGNLGRVGRTDGGGMVDEIRHVTRWAVVPVPVPGCIVSQRKGRASDLDALTRCAARPGTRTRHSVVAFRI